MQILPKLNVCCLLLFSLQIFSCNHADKIDLPKEDKNTSLSSNPTPLNSKENVVLLPKNGFNSGLLDDDGHLWFGSNGGGLYHYDGHTFIRYSKDKGLCNNQVYSLFEDKEKNIWLGTQNGLCRYDRKTFTNIPIPFKDTTSIWLDKVYPVINPNAVHSLIQDRWGDIWIGTAGGGAYSYDGENFTSHLSEIGTKQSDSLYHNWIPNITEDAEGNIWFASMTHGGISRFNGKTFTQFMPQDGLSDDMVRTIYEDSMGKLWFGFNGNRDSGLTIFDGDTFTTLTKEDGLCNTNILAIFEDKRGVMWLGSGRGNLCTYDGTSFIEFRSKDGNTFPEILFILSDLEDNIWFGGKYGLWQFDGESVIKKI